MRNTESILRPRRRFFAVEIWQNPLVQSFISDKTSLFAGIFISVVLFAAIFAPLVTPYSPTDQHLELRFTSPMSNTSSGFSVLGTDQLGRDLLTRLIYGGRISLTIGFVGVLVSGAVGVFLGLIAGYFRGVVDDVIMRVVDVFMSVPLLLLALIVLYVLGPSFTNIIIVFAIARWMLYCRITRGIVLSMREQFFIDAARAIGCSHPRIMFRHILPNLMTPVLTVAAMEVARNILTESTLSFLGMGIQPPDSSWGLMLAQGRVYIFQAWWAVGFPGLAILLTALSFNLVGAWARAVTDPLQRWRWMKLPEEVAAQARVAR